MADLTANPDSATTLAATAVNVPVLANDTLGESPILLGDLVGLPVVTTPPAVGTAEVDPEDGSITYTPPLGFCGEVTFQYTIETPDDPTCPELWFSNNVISSESVYEAFPMADEAENIYFMGPDDEYYSFTLDEYGEFQAEGNYLPCFPDPVWQVQLYWGDGSGGVCAMIDNGCS